MYDTYKVIETLADKDSVLEKLAYRNELAPIEDADERRRKYEELVAQLYERGKALSIATIFGVDDVIAGAGQEAFGWAAR